MRGGPFSETRVIELLNRRFVPYYFNTGGPGNGKDEAAHRFVTGKVPNPWAFFAAFAPDGRVLAVSGIYDGTDQVFDLLRALLAAHPELDRPTADERTLLEATPKDGAGALARARLGEELARFAEAAADYRSALERGTAAEQLAANRGLLRVLRHQRDWPAHAAVLAAASSGPHANALTADLALEQSYRSLAEKRYRDARRALQAALRAAAATDRIAELHYELGRACWFLGDRDWAKAHWCWILDHLPDDRHFQRASLAAAAEVFPYPNHELGGFEAKVGPVGPGIIGDGVAAAMTVYERLRARIEAGDFVDVEPDPGQAGELAAAPPVLTGLLDRPDSLVARLHDGGDPAANERAVERLAAAGDDAVLPLVVAAGNAAFGGHQQVATALGRLLARELPAGLRKYATDALRKLARSQQAAVAAAANAALGRPASNTDFRVDTQRKSPPANAPVPAAELPKSTLLLVARLRDGSDPVTANDAANDAVVDALVARGQGAVAALQAALADAEFPGRAEAARALGAVLHGLRDRPAAAVAQLQEASRDADPRVRAQAAAALRRLE